MDKTKIAVNVFDNNAKRYQDKFMDVNLYGLSFDFFCDNIPKNNPNILELACGPGNITRYLLNKRPDFKVLASDLSPKMLELAKVNNPGAEILLMDARDIALLSETYDGIMCGFCLPYLSKDESVKLINDAAGVLRTKGLFYLSTMEDDYKNSGFEKGSTGEEIFMHYHQEDYLVNAFRENHFEILKTDRIVTTGPKGQVVTDLIIVAAKK